MMEYQGDIESRGGSVALNSTLSSGDVSGKPTSRDIMAGQMVGPAGRQQFLQGFSVRSHVHAEILRT